MSKYQLTKDRENQQYLSVSVIPAGYFYLPDREVFDDSLDKDTGQKVPSFSFLLSHDQHGKVLFDLGIRKHGQGYPPALKDDLETFVIDCDKDIVDQLEEGGVKPNDIQTVIYSHLHFDHVGDLKPFSTSQLIVGGDAMNIVQSSYPQNPDSFFEAFPEGQDVVYIDFSRTEENNIALGPFLRAVDFFFDGSLYLIDAQGHFPGHLAALVRTGPEQFVLLAGDCCHNRLCYNPGERLISRENHRNIDKARQTVEYLKSMHKLENVVVLLAHEKERLDEMPLFPKEINGWVVEEIARKGADP